MDIKDEELEEIFNNVSNQLALKNISLDGKKKKEFESAIRNIGKNVPLKYIEHFLVDIMQLAQIESIENYPVTENLTIDHILENISVGMNDNKKITFSINGETHLGYLKSNLIPVFNDASISMYKIGTLLGINMAPTYSTMYNNKPYIISQSINENDEDFLMMQKFIEKYPNNTDFSTPIDDKEKIKRLIMMPLLSLKEYQKQNPRVTPEMVQQFTDAYVDMLCFDYITNQTDRNFDNFGVIIGKDGYISFAPLIDSDFILNKPSDGENTRSFSMQKKYNKDVAMSVLYELFPHRVQQFRSQLYFNENELQDILKTHFSEDMLWGKGDYYNIVAQNIKQFYELIPSISMAKFSRMAIEDVAQEDLTQAEIVEQRLKSPVLEQGEKDGH